MLRNVSPLYLVHCSQAESAIGVCLSVHLPAVKLQDLRSERLTYGMLTFPVRTPSAGYVERGESRAKTVSGEPVFPPLQMLLRLNLPLPGAAEPCYYVRVPRSNIVGLNSQ